MAAPNLIGASTITGKTQVVNLTTATSNVITNSSGSSTVGKVNSISLSNYANSAVEVNVVINRSSVVYYLGGGIVVPSKSTLVLIARDTTVYLEEGDVLQANTSANSSVTLTASYELISG
jgi:hypothetical protein